MPAMKHFSAPRRYLLRDACSNEPLAVVEAGNPEQARQRGTLVQRRTRLLKSSKALVVEACHGVTGLPVFKDAFFDLLAAADKRQKLH